MVSDVTQLGAAYPVDERAGAWRRRVRQERLYVLFQSAAWLTLLVLNLLFTKFFLPEQKQADFGDYVFSGVRVILLAWLLTHYVRRLLDRWGWKRLGWMALTPRVLLMGVGLSVVWSALGFTLEYVVLRLPWPSPHPLSVVFFASVVNGTILMIGWLCLYFCYHAFDRYNVSELERLRLTASVKDAELRALKAQVNPHFMFNALNSVRALIDEDPTRARQAVTQLANLLRYSLHSGALETVPLEDELQVVKDYLALEQVRHEERLRVRLEISPEALTLPVPTMLLQTLVENAVKYGVSPLPAGGEVGVVARRLRDRLELEVSNPGRLQADGEAGGAGSTGVGLRNAAERLRLLFGDAAELRLFQRGPDTVVATVALPLPVGQVTSAPPVEASKLVTR
jgi:signal transduction histidine kinase